MGIKLNSSLVTGQNVTMNEISYFKNQIVGGHVQILGEKEIVTSQYHLPQICDITLEVRD